MLASADRKLLALARRRGIDVAEIPSAQVRRAARI